MRTRTHTFSAARTSPTFSSPPPSCPLRPHARVSSLPAQEQERTLATLAAASVSAKGKLSAAVGQPLALAATPSAGSAAAGGSGGGGSGGNGPANGSVSISQGLAKLPFPALKIETGAAAVMAPSPLAAGGGDEELAAAAAPAAAAAGAAPRRSAFAKTSALGSCSGPEMLYLQNLHLRSRLSTALHSGVVVLACGDTVSSPYGDGVVLTQRDHDGVTAVKLQWGAVAFLNPTTLVLLARAAEVGVAARASPTPHTTPAPCVWS
jgi:hypothetical protein